jgi:CDGSH iron-sulfur domain-containing protein 3
VTIVDADGNEFRVEAGRPVALCRCGRSATKPFCDKSHRETGFSSCERAT